MSDTPELKPCPFCGGAAEIWRADADRRRRAWISCQGRCAVLITSEHEADDAAIKVWNARTESPDPVMQAELISLNAVNEALEAERKRLRAALTQIAEHLPLFDYVGSDEFGPCIDVPGSPFDRGREQEAKHLSGIASAALKGGDV